MAVASPAGDDYMIRSSVGKRLPSSPSPSCVSVVRGKFPFPFLPPQRHGTMRIVKSFEGALKVPNAIIPPPSSCVPKMLEVEESPVLSFLRSLHPQSRA